MKNVQKGTRKENVTGAKKKKTQQSRLLFSWTRLKRINDKQQQQYVLYSYVVYRLVWSFGTGWISKEVRRRRERNVNWWIRTGGRDERRQIPQRIIEAIENSLVVTDDVNWWLSTVSERSKRMGQQHKKKRRLYTLLSLSRSLLF